MLNGRALATVAAFGVLSDAVPSQVAVTWLTAPQGDNRRSRSSRASVSVSGDGRYVAFTSYARLSGSDVDSLADIYVLDRSTATITLESASVEGRALSSDAGHPSISADGRYLAFDTIVADDSSRPVVDVVLRDRVDDTARRITNGPGGARSNGWSGQALVVADATAVVFAAAATNLVAGPDLNASEPDIYRFDIASNAIERISVDSRGTQHQGASLAPSASADGRHVVFSSAATLASQPGASPQTQRPGPRPVIYLRDTRTGQTTLVGGAVDRPNAASMTPVISADGRSIAFASVATNLVARDRNKSSDVFLYDVGTGTVSLVSRAIGGGTASGTSLSPAISADGRWIAFQSDASDMACAQDCRRGMDDVNLLPDVFLFDRVTGKISCISLDRHRTWMEESGAPAIDASGAVVAFSSRHPVSARDVSHDFDLFVRVLAQ
jgi:Tol biopolymer transport system component